MTAIPLNAKLCHRCNDQYVGRLCPKCTTKAEFRKVLNLAEKGTGLITDFSRADVPKTPAMPPSAAQKPKRGMSAPALKFPSPYENCSFLPGFKIRIVGEVHGGKNSMGVTKTGKHYARPLFKRWREDAVSQIRAHIRGSIRPVCAPVNIRLDYVAGDRRRRDMPAILDAVFHALERAGVVKDDALIWVSESHRSYSKENPEVSITFL